MRMLSNMRQRREDQHNRETRNLNDMQGHFNERDTERKQHVVRGRRRYINQR